MPVIDPVATDSQLSGKAAVAVIGGGVIGMATALELAERGIDVVLLEKGQVAGEQSSRNWGWCRQMGRDPREIPLILESLDLWRRIDTRIGAATGFTECGILYLAETDAELAAKQSWYEQHARAYQLDIRMISGAEAERLQPGSSRTWKGALYSPSDGRAEPFKAVPAMAGAVRARGGKVFTNCAVRGLETTGGRVSAVVTEHGTVACDTVVLAGGAWSRRFCHNLEIVLPQLTVVNSVMRTEAIDTGLTRSCSGGKFAFRKRDDGGFTIASRHLSVADIMPDSFRLYLRLPAAAETGFRWGALAPRQALHRGSKTEAPLDPR